MFYSRVRSCLWLYTLLLSRVNGHERQWTWTCTWVQATSTTGMLLHHGSYGNHYASVYAQRDSQIHVIHASELSDDRVEQLTTT